jgi:putative N6-adenine-specific DNA methylase
MPPSDDPGRPQRFFAPCPRGLEGVLAAELAGLGAQDVAPAEGGVAFAGGWLLCYRINIESRIASRVLWHVGSSSYRTEQHVYDTAHGLSWERWFGVERTIRVNVAASRCPLKSIDFLTLRIKDAVCDRFRGRGGRRPDVDTHRPDIRIHAYIDAARVTFYLDTSGEALFRRGWRRSQGDAPVRENLAAGILRLAGWSPGMPFADPMCGSGTFLIEAAHMTLHVAPGVGRSFAFEKFRAFDAKSLDAIRAAAAARRKPPTPLPIFGSDLYGDELRHARDNIAAAGLDEAITVKQVNVLDARAPTAEGVLVTNPPYGVRIGSADDLALFYPKLGDALKRNFQGWRCYLFTADLRLAKLIRLSASKRTPLFNGPLECRLFEYRIVAGSMRN